ncbi:MAG TPA: outer membrane beta-barrel protein [Burkholderiales bacterium]|nr:outer membrane beta-barrel protein [Burkholderiales bacterium]
MKFRSLALLSLLAVTAPSFAGDFYVSGSLGRTSADIDSGSLDDELRSAGAAGVASSVDEKDTGFKLQLGYQFSPNFAIEGGLVDLGEFQYDATFTGGTAQAKWEAKGVSINALGILPIDDSFSLFGKIGMVNAKVEVDVTATGPGGTASGSDSEKNWSPVFGVGAIYNATKSIGIRAEYERYSSLGDDATTGEGDFDLFSVGVSFKF